MCVRCTSMRGEGRRACACMYVPSPATCFTPGQETGACFHTESRQIYNTLLYLCQCEGACGCLGRGENDRAKKQTGWLRCPQLQPIGSPKIHQSCPPANPGLPCGAGISLEDYYLAKCSQANDGQGPRDGSAMWSLRAENFCGTLLCFWAANVFTGITESEQEPDSYSSTLNKELIK